MNVLLLCYLLPPCLRGALSFALFPLGLCFLIGAQSDVTMSPWEKQPDSPAAGNGHGFTQLSEPNFDLKLLLTVKL